jgi:hypothetical protein
MYNLRNLVNFLKHASHPISFYITKLIHFIRHGSNVLRAYYYHLMLKIYLY